MKKTTRKMTTLNLETLIKRAKNRTRIDPDSFDDEFDSYVQPHEETPEYDPYSDDLEHYHKKKPKQEILAQMDYNLNSPLLSNKIDDAASNINRWSYSTSKLTKTIGKDLSGIRLSAGNWNTSRSIHKWMSQQWSKPINVPHARALVLETEYLSKKTSWIPTTYIKSLYQQSVLPESGKHISISGLRYLEFFLLFNTMVTIMNNIGFKSADFSKLLGYSSLDKLNDGRSYKLVSHIYGDIYITSMFCFFDKSRVVVDREFLLLLKDISNSRFQSISCLDLNHDIKYRRVTTHLVNLYLKGDSILTELGSQGYDVIKMLEGWCNNWLSNQSMDVKPLLPKFTKFGGHIHDEIVKKSELGSSVFEFFHYLDDEWTLEDILTFYGSYRHWGHPFIDYKVGLANLKTRVKKDRKVTKSYAQTMASDLAKKVLFHIHRTRKIWAVDIGKMKPKHPFFHCVNNNYWPNLEAQAKLGDKWHLLPLKKCFEIPDVLDPSLIYSDKSHSITREEFLEHLRQNPGKSIPSLKVLDTFLRKPATNWPDFLQKVNDEGISTNDLIIGLKAKERELKVEGRYFALLSWKLREYFVMTEYLIKEHFVPLFDGLTMADNYEEVMKKMMSSSSNQGSSDYLSLTIANHIDYSKWCNSQSFESTYAVFKVMDQFLGYNALIARTHYFFENSWFYYKDGGQDITINHKNEPESLSDYPSCWIGQKGGIEGLRQKGWSILTLLSIERMVGKRNTDVQVLAQGDNQVICTKYKPRVGMNHPDFHKCIDDIYQNNESIMNGIQVGVEHLGMEINKEETMQSTDYLNYGKIPIYRGVVRSLQTKRWSRVSCITNDSLPNFGNTLSTVTSNALTVSHTLSSCIPSILHYHWSACLMYKLLHRFNPTLRSHCQDLIKPEEEETFVCKYLYKDPSLGGIGGMSLTRFIIRGFPDPVTEGLSFWKFMCDNTNGDKKSFCASFGDLKLKTFRYTDIRKLIENPVSLNIPGSSGVDNLIKEAVREGLRSSKIPVTNDIIQNALQYQDSNDATFIDWLMRIKPLFPRFISEFYSGSYGGIMNSLVGLIQNSKTMKSIFSRDFDKELAQKVFISEIKSIVSLRDSSSKGKIWSCSYKKAKELRELSWNGPVLGASIPHPIEVISNIFKVAAGCLGCTSASPLNDHIKSVGYVGMIDIDSCRGPYRPYLGSSTNEQTSLLQTWNKTTDIPLIKRATRLLNAISWFIKPDSNLAKSLILMLQGMTGERLELLSDSVKRTGTAVHRFSSSRQSSGGFCAQNPSPGSRQIITTDMLRTLQSDNYTIMFQPLILFAQNVVGELAKDNESQFCYHLHISCEDCLDPVDSEEYIESDDIFQFPEVSDELMKWKPATTNWFKDIKMPETEKVSSDRFDGKNRCQIIGYNLGFFGSELINTGSQLGTDIESMFPVVLINKLDPKYFFEGLAAGILLNAYQHSVYRRHMYVKNDVAHLIYGRVAEIVEKLFHDTGFANLISSPRFVKYLAYQQVGLNPSFPQRNAHNLVEFMQYIEDLCNNVKKNISLYNNQFITLGDFINPKNMILLQLSLECMHIIGPRMILDKRRKDKIKEVSRLIRSVREDEDFSMIIKTSSKFKILTIDEQIRFFAPSTDFFETIETTQDEVNMMQGRLPIGAKYGTLRKLTQIETPLVTKSIKTRSLLMTSMRHYHLSTGTWYKNYDILRTARITPKNVLVGGDGSGGITSLILRMSSESKTIFNTLLSDNIPETGGKTMDGPSALITLPRSYMSRCVNLTDAWENPSDLTKKETWNYFASLESQDFRLDTIIIDMESVNVQEYKAMERHLSQFLDTRDINTLIIKCYHNLLVDDPSLYGTVFNHFRNVSAYRSRWESTMSVCFHFVCTGRNTHIKEKAFISADQVATMFGFDDEDKFWKDEIAKFDSVRRLMIKPPVNARVFKPAKIELKAILSKYNAQEGKLSDYIRSPMLAQNPVETLLCVYLDALNHNMCVTVPVNKDNKYPTDGRVVKGLVLYYCFNIWINALSGDYMKIRALEKMFDTDIVVFMNLVVDKKNPKDEFLRWSFSPLKDGMTKKLNILDKRSDCGKILRSLMMYSNHRHYKRDVQKENLKGMLKTMKLSKALADANYSPFA
ncbi:L protein [Rhizoctonia solani rhabdovirus 2]|nr:L protein [Rhizoctonia solani rhabdovirus 2]